MIRTMLALAALAVGLPAASADELKGTIKTVNKDANKLTLTIDGKDRSLAISKDASFVTLTSEKNKTGKPKEKVIPLDGGLGALKVGLVVTVVTAKAGEQDEVTSVKVTSGTAAKRKAKKALGKKAQKSAKTEN
jgi:hypothetical protein